MEDVVHIVAAQGATKAAQDTIWEAPPGDTSLEGLARDARCAAFAFTAALFVKTQSKENVFNVPLKNGASANGLKKEGTLSSCQLSEITRASL